MSESNDHLQQTKTSKRSPEDRGDSVEHTLRERMLDKTLADSFPTSDPPSSIPDPAPDNSSTPQHNRERLFARLAPGTWVALSVDNAELLATGSTRDEAEQNARVAGHHNMSLTKVPPGTDTPLHSSDAA
jgi:hypothetical protein